MFILVIEHLKIYNGCYFTRFGYVFILRVKPI